MLELFGEFANVYSHPQQTNAVTEYHGVVQQLSGVAYMHSGNL